MADISKYVCDVIKFNVKALLHYALFHSRFGFFSRFSSRLCYNMLVSKTRVEMQEKRKKNPKRENNARKLHYLYYTIMAYQKRMAIRDYLAFSFSAFIKQWRLIARQHELR